MCGIFGYQTIAPFPFEARMPEVWEALHHRGPDDRGSWTSPDRRMGLGHTRLAVVGLQDGPQPLQDAAGEILAVVNGEFYDYAAIRSDLQARGHQFRTRGDSEILIHLYRAYGRDCLKHLRGEFAWILIDRRRELLLAARDRFGVKPLLVAQTPDGVLLASEAKALFAAGVPRRWDVGAFRQAAQMQYLVPPRSLFAGITRLEPGCLLEAERGRLRMTRYWDLDYPSEHAPPPAGDDRAQIAAFRRAFEDAVAVRLQAEVPVCCHLSGGLDSTAVAVTAAHLGAAPTCFTVSFPDAGAGAPYDEEASARATAARLGLPLQVVPVTRQGILDHLAEAVTGAEGLAVNGHLSAKFLLNRAVAGAGFKVALTGEGADEVLAGYPHLRLDAARARGDLDAAARLPVGHAASVGIMLPHGEGLSLDAVARGLGFRPAYLEAKAGLGHKFTAVLHPDLRAACAGEDAYAALMDALPAARLRDTARVHRSLYVWTKTALAQYILETLGDGCEMPSSVEGRLPFLDGPLFDLVRTLPLSLKIRGSVEKYILREALADLLPPEVYARPKHPFVAPPLCGVDAAVDARVDDMLAEEARGGCPFFDYPALRGLLRRLPSMDGPTRAAYNPVLVFALSAMMLHRGLKLEVTHG